MRRLIIEEPISRAASWAPRVAWFALAVTVMAVLLIRFERVELGGGLAALATGLGLALAAAALSMLAFVRIWTEGRRGVGSAIRGLVIAAAVLAWPAWNGVSALRLPALTDVTTDIENPPAFSRSRAVLDARGGRVPPEPPPEDRAEQRAAYGRIASLTLDIPPDAAFALVQKAAANRGWRIVEAIKPGGRFGLGRVEAVDRTFLLRLPDDVTVRIRPRADGARIDVRSASRIGRHDLGANAVRIRRFLDELSNLALTVD